MGGKFFRACLVSTRAKPTPETLNYLPALTGVLPFGTMFIELYFAMTSVWLGFFYYLFFFVLAVGVGRTR